MINESEGLDSSTREPIDTGDPTTWRIGEQVEAVMLTRRGPGDLIELPGRGGYIEESRFSEVHPVDNPERLTGVKALRTLLVEERLAAASARSNATMVDRMWNELAKQLAEEQHAHARTRLRLRLATYALRFAAEDTTAFVNVLETLLGTKDRPGSLAEPCDGVLTIHSRYPGCGCDEPCWTDVDQLCVLRRGHALVKGSELHRTLGGREFETGEVDYHGDNS